MPSIFLTYLSDHCLTGRSAEQCNAEGGTVQVEEQG